MESLKTTQYHGTLIVYDAFAYEKKAKLRDFLASQEIQKIVDRVGQKFIMVLGGDGTMLRAVQEYYHDKIPFLGINFGTKGFLLNDVGFVEKATSFESLDYPLLETIVSTEGREYREVALNEIQVKTASGGMADLTFDIGKLSRVQTKGDGILISTPAGSTGYNQSAGWPVLPHTSGHFIATPLLSFEPKGLRPIVYESSEVVTIVNNNERKRKLSVYADSVPVVEALDTDMRILVHKYDQKVQLLIADTYASIWKAKTFAEQGMEVL